MRKLGLAATLKKSEIKPDINVTPLVDVVLVLLIIFMVVAPQMEAGVAVALPQVGHPDDSSKNKMEAITVSVSREGAIYLEKERVENEDALIERLKAAHAASPDKRIVLQADRQVPFATVRQVFRTCQQAGLTGVSLKVEKSGANPDGV